MADVPPYLARRDEDIRETTAKRFRADLWTVDFPRPMMAALTVPGPRHVQLDLEFLTSADLAGVIWESEDRWSHPLCAYATDRDYRGCRLAFTWRASEAIAALDSLNGAVLTIEGRDAGGVARTWYVRLWNYAEGTPRDAQVAIDFADVRAGFGPGGEPVFAGDVDRMFLSVVAAGFDGLGTALAAPLTGRIDIDALDCAGPGATVSMKDAGLPAHGMRMASGYDDSYNQAPERLVRQWLALGYRGLVNHYVGMSHFYRLGPVGGGRHEVTQGLCEPARAWHQALFRAATAAGYEIILSLSFELFDANAPAAWAQRDSAGDRALTGWQPPSTLLSPCNAAAMDWLGGIAAAFAALASQHGETTLFQVGEPWWWVGPNGRPCFYDAATVARWTAERGAPPPAMADVAGVRSAAEQDWLDWLGARLAEATELVRDAAAAAAAGAFRSHLLFYAPQVLDAGRPDLLRANMPVGWAAPAWDVLQLEDYSFVTAADESGMARGRAAVSARLGYAVDAQHYLAGFVLSGADAAVQWPRIAAAAAEAAGRGVPEIFFWAWPQIARDGFTWLGSGEAESDMNGFHDELFPLDLGFDAVGGPGFATQVALLASGHEQRVVQWANARLAYDAGLGVRSEEDLKRLLGFFRARRGRAFGFRFRDPMDFSSAPDGGMASAFDQKLGDGDGATLGFPLVKRYGPPGEAEVRRITRPDPATVTVSVGGVVQASGWMLRDLGVVQFEAAPAAGQEVRAGFLFDVPVRFDADRLEISLSGIRSGEAPSVPLVEVKE